MSLIIKDTELKIAFIYILPLVVSYKVINQSSIKSVKISKDYSHLEIIGKDLSKLKDLDCLMGDYKTENGLDYIFIRIDKEYSKSVNLIMSGKYSMISENHKLKIINCTNLSKCDLEKLDIRFIALFPTTKAYVKIKEILSNFFNVNINLFRELISKPNLELEIYNYGE